MDKNRVEGAGVGRAGDLLRSPYPSKMRSVDPATVHGRRLRLPQEICLVSRERLRRPRGNLTARQKSAEGVVGHVVGKASEALQSRKAEQPIGRAGNGGRRPEREGEGSRTWVSGTTRGRRTPRQFWTFTLRRRVKPVRSEGKRPNRSRRRMHPKAQLARINSWRKYASGKT